jgi:hypothetical protein
MPELGWWWWWFAGELVLVLVAMLAVVWWRGAKTVARLAAGGPAPVAEAPAAAETRLEAPQLDSTEIDAVDSGEAAELRSQLSRSVQEMTGVTDAAREVSTRISADLMSLLQAQAEVQNLATRASAVPELPADAKAALDELLEKLREADPLLIQAQENLDQVDASLQGMASELGRYGEESGFEWERLRPTTDGLNRLLRLKVDPDAASGGAHRSADVQLPPGLGDAIDQAII